MFSSFATQQTGIVQDNLFMNFDLQNGQLNTLVPNTGANFQDTQYNAPLRITSGSFVKSLTTPAYIDFQSASTGSQIWPTNASGAGIGYNFLTSTSWTMQAWVWWDVIAGDPCLISHGSALQNQGFHVIARENKLQFALYLDDIQSVTNLTANTWVNIGLVYNRRTGFRKEIYLNGRLDNAANGSQYIGSSPFPNNTTIGFINWIGYTGNPMNGRLGQMLWYNKALTASEIRQNYDATKQIYNIL
jgi:hypothetical protein